MIFKKFMVSMLIATSVMSTIPASTALAADTKAAEQKTTMRPCSTAEELKAISDEYIIDPVRSAKRNIAVERTSACPHYGFIKRYMMQKGPNPAFVLGVYYIPSPIVYELIQVMEREVKENNRSYIYNGKFYESPDEDPTFYSDMNIQK